MTEYVHACQISDDLASAGGELWYLSPRSYGKQTDSSYAKAPEAGIGTDCPLLVRTEPVAPAGNSGVVLARRLYIIVGYQYGGARFRVTPILDFETVLTATAFAVEAPTTHGYKRAEVEVPLARRCTWVQVEIEVLERTGRFEVLGVDVAHRLITPTGASVVGVE